MRKTVIAGLLGSAFALAGTAQAALVFDLNGTGSGGEIRATAFDWAPTSFLARGGNTAIANRVSGACAPAPTGNPALCDFDVFTHARLTAYTPAPGHTALTVADFGEITMVASFRERVISFSEIRDPETNALLGQTANFRTLGTGWLEFYWSPSRDAHALTGSGFNNGTLIGRLDGVQTGALGNFTVDTTIPPVPLDQTTDGNDYFGQQTVTGAGGTAALRAGVGGVQLDTNFFISTLTGLTINFASFRSIFQNISVDTPFVQVDPSNCFTPAPRDAAVNPVGTTDLTSTCNTAHTDGLFSAQPAKGGYLPDIGLVNGLNGQDFIAQTDFNMAFVVEGQEIPEPGTLALVGLALAGMGVGAIARRRRA